MPSRECDARTLCARGRSPAALSRLSYEGRCWLLGTSSLERPEVLVRKKDEAHLLDLRPLCELFVGRAKRDLGRVLDGVAVDAGRDRREGHRAAAQLIGDLESTAVAGGEELGLALIPAAPDRPDGVDHVPRREIAGRRGLGVTRGAAAEAAALLENRRAAGTVDRPVDAAAAEQRLVGRVHDRVDVLLRDVTLNELDPAHRPEA